MKINGQVIETILFGDTIEKYDPIYTADAFSKLTDPSALPTGSGADVTFSSDGVLYGNFPLGITVYFHI